ncbi:hypothetical protein Cni_G24533 [Canna indica]|uniref:Uncharacterized protein n=1 Tax=Canna indica TaxID=4628 RepID=A0AAQ3L2K1_9LILI|nr:hypothetical protein Cni_G24533 [Canna indica]
MSLLDKLWDDTLAGPRPDSGLGRLRKPFSSAFRSAAKDEAAAGSGAVGDPLAEEVTPRVTRSIMIKRPPGWASPGSGGTPPSSPAGSTPPVSPFSGGKECNRFSRRSMSDAYGGRGESVGVEATPTSSFPPFEV